LITDNAIAESLTPLPQLPITLAWQNTTALPSTLPPGVVPP
jgi:hypothetical protein